MGLAAVPYRSFKRIRRSTGNAAEVACPGAGHRLLGNKRVVFEANYLDAMRVETPQLVLRDEPGTEKSSNGLE